MLNMFNIILLIVMAFLPPIVYVVWIRNTEKYDRERWKPIFIAFIWGASIAVIASLILEIALFIPIALSTQDVGLVGLITAVIIAPFVEELTKPLALGTKKVRIEVDELEDGLIYGAVAGLGFSATENLFYGASFLKEGLVFFITMIAIRSFGSCLLHASATAWTGYGFGKKIMGQGTTLGILPYFLLAFLVHAGYNFVLSYDMIGAGIGLLCAFSLSVITIIFVRKKIVSLDSK